MGISAVDVQQYVHNLSGYIYAILGTLVAAIVIAGAVQFVLKKGVRHIAAVSSILAWVLIVVVIANMICFGPMYNNLAPLINYEGAVSPASAAASEAVIEKVGDEGITLMEHIPISGYAILIHSTGDHNGQSCCPAIPARRTSWHFSTAQ